MKKSEMIRLLGKSIIKHMNSYDNPSDEAVYARVLEDLVEFGMKPPVKKHNPVLLTHTYGWDKEDETKEN